MKHYMIRNFDLKNELKSSALSWEFDAEFEPYNTVVGIKKVRIQGFYINYFEHICKI